MHTAFRIGFIFMLVCGIFACQQPEEPRFIKMENVQVQEINLPNITVSANAVYHNPNPVKAKLTAVNLDLEVNGTKVGKIEQTQAIEVPANSDFKVPVIIKGNTKELSGSGILGNIISILGDKKMILRYKGTTTIEVLKVPISVPVDYEEEVNLKR